MTDEEKAIEIGNNAKRQKYFDPRCNDLAGNIAHASAMIMAVRMKEELGLITEWFEHIAQIADDKKTANGVVMKDSDAFDEIRCLAKRCADYVNTILLKKSEEQ